MSNQPSKESVYTKIFGRRAFMQGLAVGAAGVAAIPSFKPRVARAQTTEANRSTVNLIRAKEYRQGTYDVLKPLQNDVKGAIGDKNVVLKVNAGMASEGHAPHSTQADSIRGALDFLREFYDGPVTIAEGTASASCDMFIGYQNYNYLPIADEYKNVNFVDVNVGPYSQHFIHTWDSRPLPVNLTNYYTDPNAYIISLSRMKTHDALVATLSFKNVAMGAPIVHWNNEDMPRSARNEKSNMHGANRPRENQSSGRELSYNVFRVALAGAHPDLGVIEAINSIEGSGPWGGEIVESQMMVASTDFVACDRVGTELMQINPEYMKYLEWCGMAGLGNWDIANIDVMGEKISDLSRKYALHARIEQEIQWIHDIYGV